MKAKQIGSLVLNLVLYHQIDSGLCPAFLKCVLFALRVNELMLVASNKA